MNDHVQQSEEGAVRSARRRLLRGTFAVPTVMTLQSGSALAASSTLRCFRNMPTGADAAKVADNVWRIQRYATKVKGDQLLVFSGSDIKKIEGAMAGKLWPSGFETGKWYRVSTDLRGQIEADVGKVEDKEWKAPAPDGVLLALRVLPYGDEAVPRFTIAGVALDGYAGGDARIMTQSCWGSVF